MDSSLTDTDLLVRILVGLVSLVFTVGGAIVVAIRRQWSRTEAVFDKRLTNIEDDHERDIRYFERRDRDQRQTISELKADLITTRAQLRECEDRHRYPPGLNI